MKTALFIRSAVAISPQHSFDEQNFLNPIQTSNNGKLFIQDAPYQNYIPPVPIRRMSRTLKMAISAAMEALRAAGVEHPDAILTGTGHGSASDLQGFVRDLIQLEESALNPTLFIQSTYNSPNGWIAMLSGCRAYNQTFVHRGSSFELALIDAQLYANESDTPLNILAGAYDELTDEYFHIRSKRGYWKLPAPQSSEILNHRDTPGSVAGEGTAFFVLSTEAHGASARLVGVDIVYRADPTSMMESVLRVLNEEGLPPQEVAVVLIGLSGDSRRNELYAPILELFPGKPVGIFKHFCGEYETVSAFGLWMANYMLKCDKLPVELFLHNPVTRVQGPILLINDCIKGSGSVMLLSPCHAVEAAALTSP